MTKLSIRSGEIEIGKLSWRGYVALKRLISKSLEGPIANAIQQVMQGGYVDGDQQPFIASAIAAGAVNLDSLCNEYLPELIAAAVTNPPALDDLPAEDVLAIRAKLFEVNDLGALLDAEKNFYSGAISKVLERMKMPLTNNPATSGT